MKKNKNRCKHCGMMKRQHSLAREVCPRPPKGKKARKQFEALTDNLAWVGLELAGL